MTLLLGQGATDAHVGRGTQSIEETLIVSLAGTPRQVVTNRLANILTNLTFRYRQHSNQIDGFTSGKPFDGQTIGGRTRQLKAELHEVRGQFAVIAIDPTPLS